MNYVWPANLGSLFLDGAEQEGQQARPTAPLGNTPISDFVDTTGDGLASPLDALADLVYLNDQAAQQAQGEAWSLDERDWPSLTSPA